MRPVETDEDLFTLDEFIQMCKSGYLIDYDGYGDYATATEVSDKTVSPSDITSGNIDRSYTHVAWYNR